MRKYNWLKLCHVTECNKIHCPDDHAHRTNSRKYKSVFSYLHMLKTWHCPHLLLCASSAAIDRCRTRLAHSSKPAARCCSGRMGHTDGGTPYHFIEPGPHTMRSVPITALLYCSFTRKESGSMPLTMITVYTVSAMDFVQFMVND